MDQLKLAALDEADLRVLSAHCQDAVLQVGDMSWKPAEQRFIMAMNRFAWEKADSGWLRKAPYERHRSVLHFERVLGVQAQNIRQDAEASIVELLSVTFEETDAPSGLVIITLAGGGTIKLDVECLEAQLSDLGGAWETENKPRHKLS
ncbi:MAG: DUF2948 family protein [Cohaesibacteraceae bacterium]|nr:DUF2948 family protein [Cohaesibacteraceae bacterium]